jgi:hypothetical protein
VAQAFFSAYNDDVHLGSPVIALPVLGEAVKSGFGLSQTVLHRALT